MTDDILITVYATAKDEVNHDALAETVREELEYNDAIGSAVAFTDISVHTETGR